VKKGEEEAVGKEVWVDLRQLAIPAHNGVMVKKGNT